MALFSRKTIVRCAYGSLALCALLLNACNSGTSPGGASQTKADVETPQELRVFTWSDYLKEEVIREFETQTNSKVILDYFSSNEELLAKVQATLAASGRGYDVIFPSDYMASSMSRLGVLKELDHSKLSFLADFSPEFLHPAYDTELKWVLPFAWGLTGIAVNTKLFKNWTDATAVSWKDLFETKAYSGKVTLLDDSREVLNAALLATGKSWVSATEADIVAAFDYLKKTKKNLRLFAAEARPVIERAECVLCQAFSGDTLQIAQEKSEIKFVVPSEGATLWTDNMAIPKNAQNAELAYKFMAKMLSSEGALRFSKQTFYGTPNAKAMQSLQSILGGHKFLFPSKAERSKLAYITERPELLTLVDRLWTELKTL